MKFDEEKGSVGEGKEASALRKRRAERGDSRRKKCVERRSRMLKREEGHFPFGELKMEMAIAVVDMWNVCGSTLGSVILGW